MEYTTFFDKVYERLIFYVPSIIIYTYIVYALRKQNHFFGLNESSNMIDCMYYVSIVFTGTGYGEIYPQTQISKVIILSLSIIKLGIILYPIEALYEAFEVQNTEVSLDDIKEIVNEINTLSLDFSKNKP